MKNRALFTALAGLALVATVALAGCTSNPASPEEPATGGQEPGAASSFLACLTAAGVEARINDSGQVSVKAGAQPGAGGSISSGDGLLGMEGDDEGNTWVIPVNSAYFVDDPDTHDAYFSCEKQYPDFEQPQVDPAKDAALQEEMAKQEEAALTFAQCARTNGYAQVEDPNFSQANALQIPADLTEADFRTLLEECWDKEGPVFNFGQPLDSAFEAGAVLEDFLNTPTS